MSSGEGLIYHVRDELRKTVPVKRGGRIIDYEEEIVDSGESDKRLLCIESEFSSMLNSAMDLAIDSYGSWQKDPRHCHTARRCRLRY